MSQYVFFLNVLGNNIGDIFWFFSAFIGVRDGIFVQNFGTEKGVDKRVKRVQISDQTVNNDIGHDNIRFRLLTSGESYFVYL